MPGDGLLTLPYPLTAAARAVRFELLVDELRDVLRRVDPQLSDEAALYEAVHHAAHRLAGGNLVATFVG
jgi:hypothetical protein